MKERGEEGKRNVLLASAIASLVVRKVRTVRTGPKIWRGEEWGEKQVMAVHPACSCLQTDGRLKSKDHVLCLDACPEAKACVLRVRVGGRSEGKRVRGEDLEEQAEK